MNQETTWSALLASCRQWLQPCEFRIEAAAWPSEAWRSLERWAQMPVAPAPSVEDPLRTQAEQRERERFLADLATVAWRLRRRMLEPGTDRPKEALRREFRDVEAVWDVLAAAGVRVVDHTGQPFDPGQRLEVAGQFETPGLARSRVQDTVKPTVYLGDRHVQAGVVLVENPAPA